MDYKPRYFVERDLLERDLPKQSPYTPEEINGRIAVLRAAIRQAITKPTTAYTSSQDAIDNAISSLPFTIDYVMRLINGEVARYIHYQKCWGAKVCVKGESQEEDSHISFECDDFYNIPYHVFPYLPHAIVTDLAIDHYASPEDLSVIFLVSIKFRVPDQTLE